MHDPRSPEPGPRPISIEEPVRPLANDQPELAGFKDGIQMAPDEYSRQHVPIQSDGEESDVVRLAIKCPSLSETTMAESTLLAVPVHHTIGDVKRQIERTWTGKPKADGMRIFKSGQTLDDNTLVRSIVSATERNEPTPIHLVIRPGAWSASPPIDGSSSNAPLIRPSPVWRHASSRSMLKEATTPSCSSLQSHPSFPSMTIPRHVTEAPTTSEQDRHMASVVEIMDPSQYASFRSLLSWVYARYVDIYEVEWMKAYGSKVKEDPSFRSTATDKSSLEQLAKEVDCSVDHLEATIKTLEEDVLLWGPLGEELTVKADRGPYKYKKTDIDGLPYLLRIERNPAEDRIKALQARIERLSNLVLQMEKLINYQTLLNRSIPTSSRLAHGGEQMERLPRPVRRVERRTSLLRRFVLLERSDVLQVLLSSFFLTFKMAILVYVFTRGVSHTKLAMIAGGALLYVLFEAWTMLDRRVVVRRRAARRALGIPEDGIVRRHAATTPSTRTDQRTGTASVNNANGMSEGDASATSAVRSPRAPVRYRVSSPFVAEYWIERVAYWNLAEEDREIGFRPAEGSRAIATPPQHASSNAIVRGLRDYVLLPILLFVATLVPAVEQRRRRAIDRRDDLIRLTALRLEDRERRLREAAENKSSEAQSKADGIVGEAADDKLSAEGPERGSDAVGPSTAASTGTQMRPPSVLRSQHGQRIMQRRRQGGQIDINQELDAAAAAAAAREEVVEENFEQADMGFL